jgi:Protein of unknown function (DUF3714).
MNKSKIVIISVVSLLFLFVIFLFYRAHNKKDDINNDVTLNSDKPKEYSYDDVLKERETNNLPASSSTTSSGNDLSASTEVTIPEEGFNQDNNKYYDSRENEEIKRIQAQIRANNSTYDNENSGSTYSVPVRQNTVIKTKINKEMKSISEVPEPKLESRNSRFFSAARTNQIVGNSIRATVHGDQTVMDGSTLKMRLLEDAEVDGVAVPRNTFIYGTVKINNERVEVKITSVRLKNNLFKFEKEVFDRDAIKGIYVPGNIKSEARSEATDQGLNQINSNVDGIVGTGVNAVVTAGKSVLSRNIKRTKVTIKTNYEIYLQ